MSKKKVLVICDHPGSAQALPIKALVAEGNTEVIVVGLQFSQPIFAKAGIPLKTLEDFGLKDVSPESMEKLLLVVAPDLVLTGAACQEGKPYISEQTVVFAARKLGIKTLAVQDFWDMHDYYKRFTDERTGKKFGLLPDYIAILDGIAEAQMLAEGFPAKKLHITGNPHFDDLYAKGQAFTKVQRDQVRAKIGLKGDTLYFFGGNGFKDTNLNAGQYWDLDVIKIIAEVIKELPDVGVAIRLHPRMPDDQKVEISEFIANSGANMKLVTDIDSQTLALAADLTIVEFSTLGLEAVFMRRPCISLQPGLKVEDVLIVSNKNIIPGGYSKETCRQLLVEATNPEYRQFLLKQSAGFTTDGQATQRVVGLIDSLLKL